ncbi:type II secretion system F family protein [Frankia sp. AgB32]|uniref:type II secretion system F family protein n=1 Tax=Frankia sp. AgB32 TaxID=631119 RepID=UPI00200C20F7|nr:hypothetical protein [Frankia sp. AgB32]MCK9895038.1 hypothetical protein [Frankia sp. AgB32]
MGGGARLLAGAMSGALVGLGCWLLVTTALRRGNLAVGRSRGGAGADAPPGVRWERRDTASGWRGRIGDVAWRTVAGGAVGGLVLGIAVGVPALTTAGIAGGWLVGGVRRQPGADELTELGEAAATWCETVRQELDAGQPLRAAVLASCQLPPPALAAPMARLRGRLERQSLPVALAGLRTEVPHPLVATTVAVLSLTYRRGAGDLSRLMAEHVEVTRHRVAVLRDLHAARARYRRSMSLLLGLFAVSVVGVLMLWPAMAAPYRTAWGETAVVLITGAVALAVRSLIRMSRPGAVPDLFSDSDAA